MADMINKYIFISNIQINISYSSFYLQQFNMNNLQKFVSFTHLLTKMPKYNYHFSAGSQIHHKPGLTAKRIISCISHRLKAYDPERWDGVPFSFNTHWRDEGGYLDVQTSIQVHEALERQFGIQIKDRNVLIADVQTAYYIINQHHDSI